MRCAPVQQKPDTHIHTVAIDLTDDFNILIIIFSRRRRLSTRVSPRRDLYNALYATRRDALRRK